jgi:hypothetical protein
MAKRVSKTSIVDAKTDFACWYNLKHDPQLHNCLGQIQFAALDSLAQSLPTLAARCLPNQGMIVTTSASILLTKVALGHHPCFHNWFAPGDVTRWECLLQRLQSPAAVMDIWLRHNLRGELKWLMAWGVKKQYLDSYYGNRLYILNLLVRQPLIFIDPQLPQELQEELP